MQRGVTYAATGYEDPTLRVIFLNTDSGPTRLVSHFRSYEQVPDDQEFRLMLGDGELCYKSKGGRWHAA